MQLVRDPENPHISIPSALVTSLPVILAEWGKLFSSRENPWEFLADRSDSARFRLRKSRHDAYPQLDEGELP